MKLVPLGDRVVLKQLEAEETTQVRNRSCRDRLKKNHSRQRLLLLDLAEL